MEFNNLSGSSAKATVGNKAVGFERSKNVNEGVVKSRVNVPALFSSLHSDYYDGGAHHNRLESTDGAPLLTPVDFPGFNYPSVDVTQPLLASSLKVSQTRQTIDEVMEPPEHTGRMKQLISKPINIPQIPHMDAFYFDKQQNSSPKSPKMEQNLSRSPKSKMEQNLSRSPKSAPRSPKGQPKSPHQPKADSKPSGKQKKEKYQVPPRLKKKAKSHEIDRLQPEQHAEQRRKSLPATLFNPTLAAVKERANYLPAVNCENILMDVPVMVIPEEDEDKHGEDVGISTEDADMDDLLLEIQSTTTTNDNDDNSEDTESNKFIARRTLSVEDHKKSNFGKCIDEGNVEMPKHMPVALNGMNEEILLQEARMKVSLARLNVGAKEFVPRTTTPEPKVESETHVGDYTFAARPECQNPLMHQGRISKNLRQANPYMMPGGKTPDRASARINKLTIQQPNGPEPGNYVLVPTPLVFLQPTVSVMGRQTPSPDHYLPSNATPPGSLIGSPVTSRRQQPGNQPKRKKRKNKRNKISKETEGKCQSSKESVDDNDSDKISMTDKISPMREEPSVPQPVNHSQVPAWPTIKTTNYKPSKKPDTPKPEEPEPLPDGKVLCLMRGLPGCGKTTLARKLLGVGIIFSTDDYFVSRNGEYEFKKRFLTEAHDWNQKRVHEALVKGITPVIVDNTNIEKWVMRPYIEMAKKLKYDVVIREPDTPWKLNSTQLAKRCTHGVPKDKIALLLQNYEPNMTVQKVMGTKDGKEATDLCTPTNSGLENDVELNDHTRTLTGKNKLNIGLGTCDETGSNDCVPIELRNSKLDAKQSVAQKAHTHCDEALKHFTNVRKLGNVVSPNISTGSSTSLESSVDSPISVDLTQTFQKDDRWQLSNSLSDNDKSADRSLAEVKRKTNSGYRLVDGQSEFNKMRSHESQETSRKSGIINKRRIPSLIKEHKIEISDDDEVDTKLYGDVFLEQPNKFEGVSNLTSNYSDVAVNIDAKDFALLQRIEAGVEDAKKHKHTCVLIGISSNFIPSDVQTSESIPLVAILDKGSMTSEIKTDDNYNDEVEIFLSCFPSVAQEDLLHVLKQCKYDTQWASEILLDSNMCQPTNSPSQQMSSESQSTVQDPAKEVSPALLEFEKSSAISQLPITSNVAPDLVAVSHLSQDIEEETKDSTGPEKTTDLEIDTTKQSDEELILQLDATFGSQLQTMFGHDGSFVDLDLVSHEDLQVVVSPDLASRLYDAWQDTLKKKNRSANIGNLKADEDLAKKLQQEEDYLHMKEVQEQRLSSMPKHRPWVASGHTFARDILINPDGSACYQSTLNPSDQESEVGLREIMDQELNLQLIKDLELESSTNEITIAVKIKQEMLFKRFPRIDADILQNIFAANEYHLGNTFRSVECSHNLHPKPVYTVLSDKAREELEKRLLRQANEDALKSASDVIQLQTDLTEELDSEYPDEADYVDYRADAIVNKNLQKECLQKASEAHRKGQTQLATYYADKGRVYSQKIKEANREASKRIHQKINKDYLKSNILDLHHFHVDEAVEVLQDALNNKRHELQTRQQKPKTLYLSVITGRGRNSPLGIARIRQAVREFLEKNNYQFSESTPGLIRVSLKPDC
ncbi:uncharacterized protein LOC117116233 isoform X2 [Anneissia japonica]|nr:uncharacterized protein LOC117116233 isoform X2 [Anneissia japonica]